MRTRLEATTPSPPLVLGPAEGIAEVRGGELPPRLAVEKSSTLTRSWSSRSRSSGPNASMN